ncbi:MAG: trypsin-like peptidase domain-containing protein [Eubacterium sp.]|nr:trypsin-like peptidase domain-containing protein [Eubacterium sp.]
MDDFENKGFDTGSTNGSHPDYYQPSTGDTYYTPPQTSEPPQAENTTYQYSYRETPEPESQLNSYYQPPQDNDNYGSFNGNNGTKPPKKSNAAKIIVIVLVICLVIAGVGMAASVAGLVGDSTAGKDSNGETTTQSQNTDDAVQTHDSEKVPLKEKDNNYTVAGVADKVMDSCVGITVYSQYTDAYNYFYNYGYNGNSSSGPTKSGEGSGVLMSEQNGKTYILTCAHVISDGDSFSVTLNDGSTVDAAMVAYDAQTDIGVLSIDKTGLQIAEFANSDNLVVGEQVVAIGCPGGLEFMNSVTSGYISALARPISSNIGYDNECIQTDAAINPGNSGGALFNMQGQVVGINSSKIASTEYEGMGFSVPSSTAVATANSLIKVGYVAGRAKLGIQYNQLTNFNNSSTIIKVLAERGYENADGAMVIDSVDQSSDLANKDIKKYDMIIAVNGKTMTSTDIMTSILADSKPGDTVKLTIARIQNNDIEIFEIECKLIESKG